MKQRLKDYKTPEQLAEEHAEWTGELVKFIYKQAFLHAIKHAKDLYKTGEK